MDEVAPETWSPTNNLRWVRRYSYTESSTEEKNVLQQEWIEIYTCKKEWRDVEIVND